MLIYLLLLMAVVIIACVCLNGLSNRLGIPVLLAFIGLGMLFGSDGLVKIPFENYAFAENICSTALIFIMFYGGFGTKWSEAKPAAAAAVSLSTLGVILTAVFTGGFCWLILGIDRKESLLIGSVISSTDAASVFAILRSKKLNLKNNTASLLEVESGSNDPCSYMLTILMLTVMSGKMTVASTLTMVIAQLVFGIGFGVAIAIAACWIMKKVKVRGDGFDTAFVVAVALLAYALPQLVGGNGYLSVYLAGIIMGNRKIPNKRSLVHFFDGFTGLAQMLIFFLLGLLAFPSRLPGVWLQAIAIAVFLTFAARPLAVLLILGPQKCTRNQRLLVSWSGLRGAASIVFAIMATTSEAVIQDDLFHIVFCIVLFSISLQGTFIPLFARKLDMIDENGNVMRTFNDYSEEKPVSFVRLSIKKDTHPWVDRYVRDIQLPPGTLLVMILRGQEQIIPRGNTLLQKGDIVVLSAASLAEEEEMQLGLNELEIDARHEWKNRRIADVALDSEQLIILIERGERSIIPGGNVVLREGDKVVISSK